MIADMKPGAGSIWTTLERCIRDNGITVDRPQGSPHPSYPATFYPLDYGHIENTTSGDGEGIDVFVGTAPGSRVTALAVTFDATKADAEVKVLYRCTEAEIALVERFLRPPMPVAAVLRRGSVPQEGDHR